MTENTDRWVKDHCTAGGLQLNQIDFDQRKICSEAAKTGLIEHFISMRISVATLDNLLEDIAIK